MKTVVITGATSGIGLAVVQALIKRGDYVIALGRNKDTCTNAYNQVSPEPIDNLLYLPCDLSSQKEIHVVCDTIKTVLKGRGLDVLINNAAAVPKDRIVTGDNIELQFAVNHLAPFLMTHLLFQELQKNKGIIITTGSRSHYMSKLDFKNLMMEKRYFILKMYGKTKLCNALFTHQFNRYFMDQDLIAYTLDPGMVKTGIGRKRTNKFIAWVWEFYTRKGQHPDEVAPYYLQLIDNPKHKEEPYYYKYGTFIEPSTYSKRTDIAETLWNISLQMVGITKFGQNV